MKKILKHSKIFSVATVVTLVLASLVFSSCVSTMVATSLAGSDKNGKTSKKKENANSPMIALTGENDVTLVGDFFPTVLKMYEIMQTMNPNHKGLMAMTGSLNVMYANAFVQTPADRLPLTEVEKQFEEYERAKLHYLRGRDLCIDSLDGRHKTSGFSFKEAFFSGDNEKIDAAVSKLTKNDVMAAYWAAAGHLGAFSLDLMNPDLAGNLYAPAALLEKAISLDPEFSNGGMYELLGTFYCSAPGDFGGDFEKGISYIEKAMEISKGQTPGPFVTFAETVCIPNGDEKGFDENIEKALSIDPDKNKENRLMTIISQKKAKKLKAEKGNYFLEW